uniref:Hexosyltransferase n=1 Tax=Phallusia mammillata TaxID=59560 RepID=A0A6F9D749_9ASCI|nr:beta-1,3-galactosyltransferase 5-like [Phallusia mammillata]
MNAASISYVPRSRHVFLLATTVILHFCVAGIWIQGEYQIQQQWTTTNRPSNNSEVSKERLNDVLPTTSHKFIYPKEPDTVLSGSENDACIARQDVLWKMAIFIKSSAKNFKRREFLRRSWASYRFVQDGMIQTIFVVGNATDPTTDQLLNDEFMRYKDILQYSGPDDYRNISLKTLAGMQWCSQNYKDVDFYTSGDDDFLIDLVAMRNTLVEFRETTIKNRWPEYPIICMYEKRQNTRPHRHKDKWHVPIEEYKWPMWPDFCLGGFYTMSVNVTIQLWDLAQVQKPVRMDDVWITGILRQQFGLPNVMLVVPGKKRTVAKHTVGFKNDKSKNLSGVVQKDWEKLKQNLQKITTCTVPQ